MSNLSILKPRPLEKLNMYMNDENRQFLFCGLSKRSEFLYIYDVNECRGDFRIAAGAGDECLEVLRGVFGFDGALEDVEPTGERDVLAGERAILVGGDDFFTGERVRFEDAQLTLALPFKRN